MEGGGGKGLASSYITSFSAKGAKCNLLRRNTPFSLVEKYRKMNGEKVEKWFFEVTQINNHKSSISTFSISKESLYRRRRVKSRNPIKSEDSIYEDKDRNSSFSRWSESRRDSQWVRSRSNNTNSPYNYAMDLPSYANKLAWIRTGYLSLGRQFPPRPGFARLNYLPGPPKMTKQAIISHYRGSSVHSYLEPKPAQRGWKTDAPRCE